MRPLIIGEGTTRVTVDPPLVLAPLAGYTDRAFRGLVKRLGGCGLVVTEMVSSEGLSRGSAASRELAEVSVEERPVAIQLFGSDPDRMADAARTVEGLGASLVDVNMGCPVPKVTRTGAGAALMRDAERAARLVSRMAGNVRVPVTVKIRSGWDQDHINAREVALRLQEAGAAAITVHPRCRSEIHRGRAAWKVITAVKQAVTVPVIGNGDVRSASDARAMVEETGVDGIMIGRGALRNPWVFRQIRDEFSGKPVSGSTVADCRDALAFFVQRLLEYLPDHLAANRVKALLGWMTKTPPGGAELKRTAYASRSLSELMRILDAYLCDSLCAALLEPPAEFGESVRQ